MDIKKCINNIFTIKRNGTEVLLIIDDFFFEISKPLVLSICSYDDYYYFHDFGAATMYLRRRLGDNCNNWQQYAYCVCDRKQGTFQIEGDKACGRILTYDKLHLVKALLDYLQDLVLVCYADIICTEKCLANSIEYTIDEKLMEAFDAEYDVDMTCGDLKAAFDETIKVEKENDQSYRIFMGLKYLPNDGFSKWCINTSQIDNAMCVSIYDWVNGWDDGSVLENFLSRHDTCESWQLDILQSYNAEIVKSRQYEQVYTECDCTCEKDLQLALIRYFIMTVLLACGDEFR